MPHNAEQYLSIEDHVERYIKEHLAQWLGELSLGKPVPVYEIELRECLIRVEEGLKHQQDIILKFMEQVDKRFEQVDKRFESLAKRIDRFMIWSFGLTVSVGGLVVAAIKLLP